MITGAFGMLSSFNQFIGDMVVGLATIVEMIPGVAEGLAGKVSKAFDEVSQDIENLGESLAAPFRKEAEAATDSAAKTLEDQRKKNEKMQKQFAGIIGAMGGKWEAITRSSAKIAKTNEDIIKKSISISAARGGLSLTGSQESVRLRNPTADKMLVIATKQLSETKKSRMAQERIGSA